MAKTQKYPEDRLLEAVIKFAEVEKGKIKATELARWCRSSMEGLEEVRDYHFTRPVKERDKKTGRVTERPKLCTVRMDEINKSRSLTAGINANLLLKASNIDTFMEQPAPLQRKLVAETRETVDRLLAANQRLARENDALKAENRRIAEETAAVSEKLDLLVKTQERLAGQVTHLMKITDEASRKEMLAGMGIMDGAVDLDAYTESLQMEINKVVHISRALAGRIADGNNQPAAENRDTLAGSVLSGLDF